MGYVYVNNTGSKTKVRHYKRKYFKRNGKRNTSSANSEAIPPSTSRNQQHNATRQQHRRRNFDKKREELPPVGAEGRDEALQKLADDTKPENQTEITENVKGKNGENLVQYSGKTNKRNTRKGGNNVANSTQGVEATLRGPYNFERPGDFQAGGYNREAYLIMNLSLGYFASLRKAGIRWGKPAQQDKYIPPINLENNYNGIYAIHFVFTCAYNAIRNGSVLPVEIPRHIAFYLYVLAEKQLVQTSRTVVDQGEQALFTAPINMYQDNTTATARVTPLWDDFVTGFFGKQVQANWEWLRLQDKKPHPFTLQKPMESDLAIYSKSKGDGEAIMSTLKFMEIGSVYGYSKSEPGNSDRVRNYENYDYNGVYTPSSAHHFRTYFYPQDLSDVFYPIAGAVAPQVMIYQSHNPTLAAFHYAATGLIVTAEYTLQAAIYPFIYTDDYKTGTSKLWANVQNLSEKAPLSGKIGNEMNLVALNFVTLVVQGMQFQMSNFFFNDDAPLEILTSSALDPASSAILDFAVFCSQFTRKIPFFSTLFEEIKAMSDIKTWTVAGRAEPTSVYYRFDIGSEGIIAKLGAVTIGAGNLAQEYVTQWTNTILTWRHFIKLNHAPETTGYMPNMHIFYNNNGRIFSPVQKQVFDEKELAIFMDYSYKPILTINRPLPLNFIYTENLPAQVELTVDNYLDTVYPFCVDFSTNGSPSEIDHFYEMLREKKVGMWGALASLFAKGLPLALQAASTIFKSNSDKQEVDHPANMLTGAMQTLTNHIGGKQISVSKKYSSIVPALQRMAKLGGELVSNVGVNFV